MVLGKSLFHKPWGTWEDGHGSPSAELPGTPELDASPGPLLPAFCSPRLPI